MIESTDVLQSLASHGTFFLCHSYVAPSLPLGELVSRV